MVINKDTQPILTAPNCVRDKYIRRRKHFF